MEKQRKLSSTEPKITANMSSSTMASRRILALGLGQYLKGDHPGIGSPEENAKKGKANVEKLKAQGFDVESFSVNPEDPAVVDALRVKVKEGSFDAISVGGGLRMFSDNTLVFEKAMNMLFQEMKSGAKLCFPRSPDELFDAITRVFRS